MQPRGNFGEFKGVKIWVRQQHGMRLGLFPKSGPLATETGVCFEGEPPSNEVLDELRKSVDVVVTRARTENVEVVGEVLKIIWSPLSVEQLLEALSVLIAAAEKHGIRVTRVASTGTGSSKAS